jgi:hypothetical protein
MLVALLVAFIGCITLAFVQAGVPLPAAVFMASCIVSTLMLLWGMLTTRP